MSGRWQRALKAEEDFWQRKREVILSPRYREEIKERAARVERWISTFIEIRDSSTILEIGGGGTQLIDFFPRGRKYALDPLASFYRQQFQPLLHHGVIWARGKAEALPYPEGSFDIIVSRNTLDHVDNAPLALAEMRRVLATQGVIYLGLNTFSGILYYLRLLKKSVPHPFLFSPASIAREIRKAHLRILDSLLDVPENMMTFAQEEPFTPFYRRLGHHLLRALNCYHFSEFLLGKGENS